MLLNNGSVSELRSSLVRDFSSPLTGGLGHSKAQETIDCLTKAGIREGRNKRQGEDGSNAGYSGGYSSGKQTGGSYGGSSIQQSKTKSPPRYDDPT